MEPRRSINIGMERGRIGAHRSEMLTSLNWLKYKLVSFSAAITSSRVGQSLSYGGFNNRCPLALLVHGSHHVRHVGL